MQVTWHLLGMFFWEIYKIFRTGFTRNTRECRLLQLVVAGKCFDQKIFFKKYLIRFDIQWHVLPGIKCITDIWRPFMMFILVCTWFVWFTFLCDVLIWKNVYVMSIVLITHAVHFSNQEVLRRWTAHVSSSKSDVHEMIGRKNNCKLIFFFQCTSFEITKKYIWLLKIVKNSGHKLYRGKMVQNDNKLCLSHSISQEAYIIWLLFLEHMCKMMTSPVVVFFSFFQNCDFMGRLEGKRAKNDPK